MSEDKRRPRLLKGADVQVLRELLGISSLDMHWLLGTDVPKYRTTKEGVNQLPLSDPTESILVRYLLKYPESAFVPQMPGLEDVYPLIKKHFETDEGVMPARKLGPLWGMSGWTGNQWLKGNEPSRKATRLFKLFMDTVDAFGEEEAFKRLLSVVNEEARARGFFGELEEVQKYGSWNVRKNEEEVETGIEKD
ncbi:MAG: hypothetical protein RBR06_08680 [Desulfuromonadaceae bacterium]|nr:hypothetical protein [Desulfuromonadaceae bacterium]